jgi:hypothetical protein
MPVYLAPHTQDSPDLPPSDFLLFGYLKEKMIGREFESADALLDWVRQDFEGIRPDVLERAFECWITRVEKCIEHKGPTSLKTKELRAPFLPKVSGIADANLLLDTLYTRFECSGAGDRRLGGGIDPILFASSLTRSIPVELGVEPAQILMSACLAPISTPPKVDRGGCESEVSFPSSPKQQKTESGRHRSYRTQHFSDRSAS